MFYVPSLAINSKASSIIMNPVIFYSKTFRQFEQVMCLLVYDCFKFLRGNQILKQKTIENKTSYVRAALSLYLIDEN